jgi:hypothetical protein
MVDVSFINYKSHEKSAASAFATRAKDGKHAFRFATLFSALLSSTCDKQRTPNR